MKKIVYFLLGFIFLGFVFSCGAVVEELIVGEWTLENAEIANIDDVGEKLAKEDGFTSEEDIKEYKKGLQQGIKKEFEEGTKIEFTDGNKFIANDQESNWKLSDDKQTIIVTNDEGDDINMKIKKITNDELDLTMEMPITDDITVEIDMFMTK